MIVFMYRNGSFMKNKKFVHESYYNENLLLMIELYYY